VVIGVIPNGQIKKYEAAVLTIPAINFDGPIFL
jgi:hypothetical protein